MPCLLWYLHNKDDLSYLLADATGYDDEAEKASDDWEALHIFLLNKAPFKFRQSYEAIHQAYEKTTDDIHHKFNKHDTSTHQSYCNILLNLLHHIFIPKEMTGEALLANEYFEYWKERSTSEDMRDQVEDPEEPEEL